MTFKYLMFAITAQQYDTALNALAHALAGDWNREYLNKRYPKTKEIKNHNDLVAFIERGMDSQRREKEISDEEFLDQIRKTAHELLVSLPIEPDDEELARDLLVKMAEAELRIKRSVKKPIKQRVKRPIKEVVDFDPSMPRPNRHTRRALEKQAKH